MNTVVYNETDVGHIKIVLLILSRKLNQHSMSLLRQDFTLRMDGSRGSYFSPIMPFSKRYYISFRSYHNKLPRIGCHKRNLFSHSCARDKAEIKVLEGPCSLRSCWEKPVLSSVLLAPGDGQQSLVFCGSCLQAPKSASDVIMSQGLPPSVYVSLCLHIVFI